MNKKKHDDERAMEEALASIRKIIKKDEPETAEYETADRMPQRQRETTFGIIASIVLVPLFIGLIAGWWNLGVFFLGFFCVVVLGFLGAMLGWWRVRDVFKGDN